MVKAYWQRQLVDRMVVVAFTESLVRVEFRDAALAVRDFSDSGREEPPTVGMIYRAAREIEKRREEEERRRRRLVEEVPPSDEEKQRVKQVVGEFLSKPARPTAGSCVMTECEPSVGATQAAVTTSVAERAIDPETQSAQNIILERRVERQRTKVTKRDGGA